MKNDPLGSEHGGLASTGEGAVERLERVRRVLEKAHTFTALAQGLARDEHLRDQSAALLDVGTAFLTQAVCEFDAALIFVRSTKSQSL